MAGWRRGVREWRLSTATGHVQQTVSPTVNTSQCCTGVRRQQRRRRHYRHRRQLRSRASTDTLSRLSHFHFRFITPVSFVSCDVLAASLGLSQNCPTWGPVSTEMGDRLRAGIVSHLGMVNSVLQPTGSLNRVPALLG